MIGRLCAILCGVALTWACAAFGIVAFGELHGHRCSSGNKQALRRVIATEQAPTMFWIAHRRCPADDDELISADYVAAGELVDPCGTALAYSCSGGDVTVRSAGPDRTLGTFDDVTAPRCAR